MKEKVKRSPPGLDRGCVLTGCAAILAACLSQIFYAATPQGQVPLLDGRENIGLARQIVSGDLPPEPFYRAMIFPLALAPFAAAGIDDAGMMRAAGLIGIASHAAAAMLVFSLSGSLLGTADNRPALREIGRGLAGGLYAVYPPALFFAGEPLDTSLGIALALGGVRALVNGSRFSQALAGGLLMLATLTRPHFLPMLAAAPAACTVMAASERARAGLIACLRLFTGAMPVAILYGCWQLGVGGQFGMLPWQGAYNLWKANGPGANGRFLSQHRALGPEELAGGRNPTRVESEILYKIETGRDPEGVGAIRDMARHWRQKTLDHVLSDPAHWVRLMGAKFLFLLNDREQYNNKTFWFQKSLNPALAWNPVGWGVLFTLAWAAAPGLLRSRRRTAAALLLLAAAYFLGASLFFASDRFRLPLAPFAAIFCGPLSLVWVLPRRFAAAACASGLAGAALAFPPWAGAEDPSTARQDMILLSNAAAIAGDDLEALRWAEQALACGPPQPDIIRIIAQARFNLHVTGKRPMNSREQWREFAAPLAEIGEKDPVDHLFLGIAAWKLGADRQALAAWSFLASEHKGSRAGRDALAMAYFTGSLAPENAKSLLIPVKGEGGLPQLARRMIEREGAKLEADDRQLLDALLKRAE